MPFEKGGRADKMGNRYEIRCIIYELLNVLNEKNYSVVIEAIGDDEVATDILITNLNGVKEHQQCKARNASKEYWSISDLVSRDILRNWKKQLDRGNDRKVTLVSEVVCTHLRDLNFRAMNTNDNPADFYEFQIQTAGKELKKSYNDFCKGMQLETTDVAKSIDYLKRINIKHISGDILLENIYQQISYYFVADKDEVYNAFVRLVVDKEILGKDITGLELRQYFQENNIQFRMFDGDKSIYSKIELLNDEYRQSFMPLKDGLIARKEFYECIDAIKEEQSFVITGNAGYGKSGCSEAIINYCKQEMIPYIAIKLDRRIPHSNSKIWGQELGFSDSIVYALNVISRDKPAVLILDQLDALRWTQANSNVALSVCMEMIKQVEILNKERSKKIVIVFVCRKYDLINDNNIKSLFKKENDNTHQNKWKKIEINTFDENIVKKIVGNEYDFLSKKMRDLLKIPSNLYIFQHLDKKEKLVDCITTSNLIEEWFEQICQKSNTVGVETLNVQNTVKNVVELLDGKGKLHIFKRVLDVDKRSLDYLISTEMLVENGNKVGFAHQSILDYFVSRRMTQQYFNGENIEQIIGEFSRQTPGRRYQVQMFFQNLFEYDSADFLAAGIKMLESEKIRFYVKYVFYEILGEITNPDKKINEYVLKECKIENKWEYFVNNVVCGNRDYVVLLRESGILNQWYNDDKKKNLVFVILRSVALDLDIHDVEFIKKHAFVNEEDDKKFMKYCFYDIMDESDAIFNLRMQFYNKYPKESLSVYIDAEKMLKKCGARLIELIAFWLEKSNIIHKSKISYSYTEDFIFKKESYLYENGKYILDKLIQYVPLEVVNGFYFSDWAVRYHSNKSLERKTIEILKQANYGIILEDPEYFWNYYIPYMGKGYDLFNELILHGLQFLPENYSNRVIKYLIGDFEKKVFDYTSGEKGQLELLKKVLKVHVTHCSKDCLNEFLDAVVSYIPSKSCEWYKQRIAWNKEKRNECVYWSFWGDFQYHILQCIPYELLTVKHKELLSVLNRKFKGESHRYIKLEGHSGCVKSPVSGKHIGIKQWLQIITNNKILFKNHRNIKEVKGGFIESSIDMYATSFQSAVCKNPAEFIKMVIENKENILPPYIDSLYFGVQNSEFIKSINQSLLEQMFRVFPCDLSSHRIFAFCDIIKNTDIYSWSEDVIEKLKQLATCCEQENEEIKDCKDLMYKSLNCLKGYVTRAIGHLLQQNKELFIKFKEVINQLTMDEDTAVRMACFNVLWPIYNIDKEWAQERIIRIYESDVRMAGLYGAKDMFIRLYLTYKKRILLLVKKCFEANDKHLMEIGGYMVCEFYLIYREFEDLIFKTEQLKEEQVKSILHIAIIYLEYDEYREISKSIILRYKDSAYDIEIPLSRIFFDNLVDVERDSEFLKEIMNSKVSKKTVYSFVRYLEKNAYSVVDYADIIISLCENVLNTSLKELDEYWGIEDVISKLIITLYDETVNLETEDEISMKCLDLWDVMFEKQIGKARYLSKKLMER